MRRLALVLALLALSGSPALAAERLHVVVTGQNHHPKVGAKWQGTVGVIPVGSATFQANAFDVTNAVIYAGSAPNVPTTR